MSLPLALAAAALLLALALRWRRREEALRQELAALAGKVEALAARLDASEQDLAGALSASGVAESLLLEKGIADEDEVEAMRRRLGGEGGPRQPDGSLH
jgi:hypothetical protein